MRPALAAIAFACTAACTGGGAPELWITEVEVSGETDFGLLEVEVHLFDAQTRAFIGCSGQDHGLEQVDASDVRYDVDAYLREGGRDRRIDPIDLAGRLVEIQVVEDDENPCPSPPGTLDDVIGISGPVDGGALAGAPFTFDRVVSLRFSEF